MTNGEKLCIDFPNMRYAISEHRVITTIGVVASFDLDWWNAEYKEPTAKNDITENCIACKYDEDDDKAERCKKCLSGDSQFELDEALVEPTTKNDLGVEEHKGEVMDFPSTFDEFAKDYGFKDKDEIYTNGSELIPVFRVKQWLEHIATTKNDLGDDCISRKAVFETIDDCNSDGLKGIFCSYDDGERFKKYIKNLPPITSQLSSVLAKNSKKLEKDFGELDCISRQAVLDLIADYDLSMGQVVRGIHALPPVTPQEPRWIPVEERLPDTDDEVLCWYEYYHWSQKKVLPEYGFGCYLRETSAWFGEVAIGHKVRVLAWMPLPGSYKAESEE